jgi:hypothetical protein
MDDKIVAIYCLCADILDALGHVEDPQQRMSDAEVITTGLVAMWFLRSNCEAARTLLSTSRYMPRMLSRSRLNRRLHRLADLFLTFFELWGHTWKQLNPDAIYIIDSFPIAVCDNYRIPRVKLYKGEAYRGYIASKQRYCYGLEVHLMVTQKGQPVECFLTPGSYSDVRAMKTFAFDVPEGSHIYADKAYNDYQMEDALFAAAEIHLSPIRKKHSTRTLPPYSVYVQHYYRKRIETVGSLLESMLPNTIHAVTAQGFELKVFLFVLAYSINCL